jgi:hypothetical protein
MQGGHYAFPRSTPPAGLLPARHASLPPLLRYRGCRENPHFQAALVVVTHRAGIFAGVIHEPAGEFERGTGVEIQFLCGFEKIGILRLAFAFNEPVGQGGG